MADAEGFMDEMFMSGEEERFVGLNARGVVQCDGEHLTVLADGTILASSGYSIGWDVGNSPPVAYPTGDLRVIHRDEARSLDVWPAIEELLRG